MITTTQLFGVLLAPVAGAALVALTGRRPNLREAASLVAACVLAWLVYDMAPAVLAGARPSWRGPEIFPGVPIAFEVEPLGMVFALVAASLWIVSIVYSVGYMRGNGEGHQSRFFACFALAIGATMGIAFAGNLLTLFLFYEALTLVTWPLVAHHGDDESRNGARTYLGVLILTSTVFLLPAIIVTWAMAGTLDFTVGGILSGKLSEEGALVLASAFILGIGKAAVMPFHRWLPAAMVAPTPVSALLHAVAVVKAGVFSVVKVLVYVFGLDFLADTMNWLPWFAGFTILAASVLALRADNLKRRLAYSTVSQLSYVVMAATLLAPLSMIGAALHIVAHAVGKITLFFAAGAVYTASHKTRVSELDGIGRTMPFTMTAFGIAALSMIGLPPTIGMVSKWFMVSGAWDAGAWMALGVILASTLLNAGYFLPIVHRAFLRPPTVRSAGIWEAPWTMVLAMTVTAGATVLLFFFADAPLAYARALVGG